MNQLIARIETLLIVLFLPIASCFADNPSASRGVMDARRWDFVNDRLALQGDWNFHPNELLTPEQIQASQEVNFTTFPKIWNENGAPSGFQFATYSLTVLVSRPDKPLSIDIPQMYCSYQLWVNGKFVARNGRVGRSRDEATPQWLPQTVGIEMPGDTLQFVLQISNFYHFKGGSKEPIFLGSSEHLENQRRIATGSNLMEALILAVVGLVFLVLWFSDQDHRLFCLVVFHLVGPLCFFKPLPGYFDDPHFNWHVMIRIEYLTLYLTMIWGILFLNRLFPLDGNPMAKYLLVGVNIVFGGCTLFFDPVFFTRLLPIYLSFGGFLLVYAVYIIIRAWINEHAGVWFMILGILLGVLIFSYDMFSYEGFFTYNPLIFSIGYIAIFLLVATSLLLHLNIIKGRPRTTILTYNDLYKDAIK